MAVDDVKLDQGNKTDPKTSAGITEKNQSDLNTPSDGDTNPTIDGSKSYELKINGKMLNFTEDELIEAASKGIDYTQKMQMLADEKKRIEPYLPFIDKMSTDVAYANSMIEASNEIESQDNQSSDSGTDPQTRAQILNLQKQVSDLTMGTKFDALEEKSS